MYNHHSLLAFLVSTCLEWNRLCPAPRQHDWSWMNMSTCALIHNLKQTWHNWGAIGHDWKQILLNMAFWMQIAQSLCNWKQSGPKSVDSWLSRCVFGFPVEVILIPHWRGWLLPTWMTFKSHLIRQESSNFDDSLHERMPLWEWSCFSQVILKHDQKHIYWLIPLLSRLFK
jgi:hypothetical protein